MRKNDTGKNKITVEVVVVATLFCSSISGKIGE